MNINKLTVTSQGWPADLNQLAQPPSRLFWAGQPLAELLRRPRVAIVGSRRITPYGRQVTGRLSRELACQGVVIVSGLAAGVDATAHEGALDAGGLTIAVLPGPVDNPVPFSNRSLARRIIKNNGALVSEYESGSPTLKHQFVARNRLVAALADAVLITEAAQKSGSLHTARFALEQGKDVLAVPGAITSPASVGTNNLIKSGAVPVTDSADILHVLGLKPLSPRVTTPRADTPNQQILLDLLQTGIHSGEALQQRSGLPINQFNQALTMLEIHGLIRAAGANQWSIHAN